MTKEQTILDIANKHHLLRPQVDQQNLTAYNLDSFDFYEVSVWGVRAALEAAYEAGRQAEYMKDEVYREPTPIVGENGYCTSCGYKQPCGEKVLGDWHKVNCPKLLLRSFGVDA